MPTIEINLLKLPSEHNQKNASKRHTTGAPRALFVFFGIFALLLAGTSAFSYAQSQSADSVLSKTFNSYFGTPLHHLGVIADQKLSGEERDRVNVLLLGIGGELNDAPYLTDTIIIASLQPSTGRVAFISIPRDLAVEMDTYGWRKINSADAYGEQQQAGFGPELARQVISKTLDIPIDYTVRTDFTAFTKIIDIVGGVQVTVDRAFTDYSYPTYDHKYQVVSFKEGPQILDGEHALKFVRSRHSGMNGEGSDFARSKRQQKIIAALKEKLASREFFLNPRKISDVLATLKDNILTNFQLWEMLRIANLLKNSDLSHATHFVFDDSPENYLTSNWPDGGAYMLHPKTGNFEAMQEKVATIFTSETVAISLSTDERPIIVIRNGTTRDGFASRTAATLKEQGFTVESFGNAKNRSTTHTTIYDYSADQKSKSTDILKKLYPQALFLKSGLPEELDGFHPDYLLILGSDIEFNTPS